MKKYIKSIYSLILSFAIILGAIAPINVQAVSLVPNLTSTAYNSDNIYTISGYKGQCTWFAYGRTLEKLGIKLPSEFYSNAITWYSRNIADKVYNYGTYPKTNSIAVWSGGSAGNGHVAFVEKVSNEMVSFNEGNYTVRGNYDGCLKTLSVDAMKSRGNIFIVGYIYVGEAYYPTQYGLVNLTYETSTLNIRSGASTSCSILGIIPNNHNVTIVGESGTWYKINYANSTGYVSKNYIALKYYR